MKRYNFELARAFHKTDIGLDGIIRSLGGEPIPRHKETIVWYNDESISSYNIEGELEWESIPNIENVVKVEIGDIVTSIGEHAFVDSELTSVTIPDSVTSIGGSAFNSCSSLTSVTIPAGVTSIGYSAFDNCSGLTSITIPSSVTSIGEWAFIGCSGLTSIIVDPNNQTYDSRNNCNAIINTSNNELIAGCKNTIIPSSVTSIYSMAFAYCSGLTSVTIPSSVTSIGDNAFSGCSGLANMTADPTWARKFSSIRNLAFTILDGVTSIGDYAFEQCSGLTSVTIPDSVTIIGWDAFNKCSGLTSVTIPNSVIFIGNSAFGSCSRLTNIVLGNSVTSIGDFAFARCSNLSSITCQATTAPTVQSGTFGGNSNTYIGYPTRGNNVLKIPQGATGYNSGAWADPLQDANKCGFHIEYLD